MIPRCPYLDVLRRDSRCEASGTMFRWLTASSRSWTRGSVGRLSESEALFVRLVKSNWRKRLLRQNQNGKWEGLCGPTTYSGIHHSHRVKDANLTHVLESFLANRVSPMNPAKVVSRAQVRGMVQGVEEVGESERCTVIVQIGRMPDPKGCPLPTGLRR